jgi:prefoldin subunit 5
MDEQGYKDQIAALQAEIDALEATVKELEAEGLQPLVDRLRLKIGAIKKLTKAMATAIDELLETHR